MRKSILDICVLLALIAFYLFVCISSSSAQNVAVNQSGATAHSSAMLDVSSTNKGLLIPRMTTNQRTNISSPATGLLVYDTDLNTFMYFNGSGWTPLSAAAAPGGNGWQLLGNSGIDPASNFIGTTDNVPVHFRVNNQKAGRLDINGNALYGYFAGASIVSGANNVAIGTRALFSVGSKNKLIAIGDSALHYNVTGERNTAVGSKSIYLNTGSSDNSAFGFETLLKNAFGNSNCAFGSFALTNNGSGSLNNAFGSGTLFSNTNGTNNTAMGHHALYFNTTGFNNTAIGMRSMDSNTVGNRNAAVGTSSLISNDGGNFNSALGFEALKYNTAGSSNTSVGYLALGSNITGSYNTGVGKGADVGSSALQNATAIGAYSRVDASNSLVLGSVAGVNGGFTTVNVGIGTTTPQARLHLMNGAEANYATNGYLMIGNIAGDNVVYDDDEILARNNGGAAPLFLQANGGNIKIGNSVTPTYLLELATNSAGKPGSNTWTIVSDARLKKDIKDFKDGLSVIKQINPVWFKYNGEAGIKDTAQFVGILAQDIKKVAPYMVSEKKYKDEKGNQTNYLNYDGNAMTYILINAIKELHQEVEDLKKQLKKDQ